MKTKKINWVSVGFSLASIHYGLGFLVGTGESIFTQGVKGILYPFSAALGVLSLAIISPFYLKLKKPIWELMGQQYGTSVKRTVAFLSGSWMFGVIASQILGGGWALSIFGFNRYLSMILIATLIYFLSRLNTSKLSKMFFYMLMFSSVTLFIIFLRNGISFAIPSMGMFFDSLQTVTWRDFFGVILSTILVTFIGMDFHQFIVRSKNTKQAVYGTIFGGGILLVLTFVLLSIITGAMSSHLIGVITDPKQVVPSILQVFGNNLFPGLGLIFSLPIIFVSIGSGSGVTRVLSRTISDVGLINNKKLDIKLITVVIGFLIALTGESIITLIVAFYAMYVASVFVPFVLYLIERSQKYNYQKKSILFSLWTGFLTAIAIFLFRRNEVDFILLYGFITSFLAFVLYELYGRSLHTYGKKS